MKTKNIRNYKKSLPGSEKKKGTKNMSKNRRLLKKQLNKESKATDADSLEILAEFESLMGEKWLEDEKREVL